MPNENTAPEANNSEPVFIAELPDAPPPPLSRTQAFYYLIGKIMDRLNDSVAIAMLGTVIKIVLTPVIFILRCIAFGLGLFLLNALFFGPLVAPVVGPYLFDNPDIDVPLVTMSLFFASYFSYLAYEIKHGNDVQWHLLTRGLSKSRHSVQTFSPFVIQPTNYGRIEQARRQHNAIVGHRIRQAASVGTDEEFRKNFWRHDS